MTVTKTQKGRYIYLLSDATGATTIAQDLAQALSDEGVSSEKVIAWDVSNKFVVAEV